MNRQNDHSFLQPEQLKTMQEKDFGNSSMKDDMSERMEDSPVRFDKEAFDNEDKIISTSASDIQHSKDEVESFDGMFEGDIHDSTSWFNGYQAGFAIPIGYGRDGEIRKLILEYCGHSKNVLVSGSRYRNYFLITLIMSALVSYSPDDVQIYLLDFKEGRIFREFTRYRLPSLRVVAINSEREYGLSTLKELIEESERRRFLFRLYNVYGFYEYLRIPDAPKLPRILLIVDELQEFFRNTGHNDPISKEGFDLLMHLLCALDGTGIHVIFACDDFTHCAELNDRFFIKMANRIAMKGSTDGASSILKSGNGVIQKLLEKGDDGAAIYNDKYGEEYANSFLRISYLEEDERMQLLGELDKYFTDPEVASMYEDKGIRLFLTNAEDDPHNCFNRFISEGSDGIEPLGSSKDGYGLLLGLGYKYKRVFIPEFRMKKGDNLMVATPDEKMAISLFEYAAMSVLYEELHMKPVRANALIYMIDQSDTRLFEEACTFDYLESVFPLQIKTGRKGDAEDIIASVYNILQQRSEGTMPSDERIIFMFFGIHRSRRLLEGFLFNDENDYELSPVEMLQRIFHDGPEYGINCMIWGETPSRISRILGDRYELLFNKRIAYDLNADEMERLVDERRIEFLSGKTAVYFDVSNDYVNTHFRPYDIPLKAWIKEYACKYDETVNGGSV